MSTEQTQMAAPEVVDYEIEGDQAAMVEALLGIAKDVEPIRKDGEVKGRNGNVVMYRYAGLPSVLDVVKPVLSAHNVVALQSPIASAKEAGVVTTLMGATWKITSRLRFPLSKAGPQDIGSVLTYCRRYALLGLLNLAPDDDDDAAGPQANHNGQRRNGRSNGNGHAPAPPDPAKIIEAFAKHGITEDALVAELNGTPLAKLPPDAVAHLQRIAKRLRDGEQPLEVLSPPAVQLLPAPDELFNRDRAISQEYD